MRNISYQGDPRFQLAMEDFLAALDRPNLEFSLEATPSEIRIDVPIVGGVFLGQRDTAIAFIEDIQRVNAEMAAEGAPRGPLDDNLDRICAAIKKAITQ